MRWRGLARLSDVLARRSLGCSASPEPPPLPATATRVNRRAPGASRVPVTPPGEVAPAVIASPGSPPGLVTALVNRSRSRPRRPGHPGSDRPGGGCLPRAGHCGGDRSRSHPRGRSPWQPIPELPPGPVTLVAIAPRKLPPRSRSLRWFSVSRSCPRGRSPPVVVMQFYCLTASPHKAYRAGNS
jgi:hypothetical protein